MDENVVEEEKPLDRRRLSRAAIDRAQIASLQPPPSGSDEETTCPSISLFFADFVLFVGEVRERSLQVEDREVVNVRFNLTVEMSRDC